MANDLSAVYTLTRALLADVITDVYTDGVLLPFAQMAYREAARVLRSGGMSLFRKEATPIALPAYTRSIVRASLPADLLRPLELHERPASGGQLKRMALSDGQLPDETVTNRLQIWDWRDDTLWFIGATIDTDVTVQYEASLTDLSNGTDPVRIQDGLDAVAWLTASNAAVSRDAPNQAKAFYDRGMNALGQILANEKAARVAISGRWGTP